MWLLTGAVCRVMGRGPGGGSADFDYVRYLDALAVVKPGVRDNDVAAAAYGLVTSVGKEALVSSATPRGRT